MFGLDAMTLADFRRPSRSSFLRGVKFALVVAAAAWLPATTTTRASLMFEFSFASVAGTVTGEIDGLIDNAHSAAEHVLIGSITGITAPFALPYDTIIDNTFPYDNEFFVTAGHITSASYHAANATYTLDLEGPGLDAVLLNDVQGEEIVGPIEYTPVTMREPSSLAVLGTLAGLFLLRFSRGKRRDRHIRRSHLVASWLQGDFVSR